MDDVFLELKLNFFTKLFDFVFIRKTYFSIQQGIRAFKYILLEIVTVNLQLGRLVDI